jgi:hypothetical protein
MAGLHRSEHSPKLLRELQGLPLSDFLIIHLDYRLLSDQVLFFCDQVLQKQNHCSHFQEIVFLAAISPGKLLECDAIILADDASRKPENEG